MVRLNPSSYSFLFLFPLGFFAQNYGLTCLFILPSFPICRRDGRAARNQVFWHVGRRYLQLFPPPKDTHTHLANMGTHTPLLIMTPGFICSVCFQMSLTCWNSSDRCMRALWCLWRPSMTLPLSKSKMLTLPSSPRSENVGVTWTRKKTIVE